MRVLLSAVLILLAVGPARAERPTESKEDAPLIVVGRVEKITTSRQSYGGDGELTNYVAEVKVDEVERGRGTGVTAGDTVKVSWFCVTKAPTRPIVGASGHAYAVKEKDTIRAWLTRGTRKTYEVIYNSRGIEKTAR